MLDNSDRLINYILKELDHEPIDDILDALGCCLCLAAHASKIQRNEFIEQISHVFDSTIDYPGNLIALESDEE